MCQAMMESGGFDPGLCPLLQHLTPEEQQQRMRSDPAIAACVGALARANLASADLATSNMASANLASTAVPDAQIQRRLDTYRTRCLGTGATGAAAG